MLNSKRISDIITYKKGKAPQTSHASNTAGELPYLSPEYLRNKALPEIVKVTDNLVIVEDGDLILLWDGSNAGEFFKAKKGVLASTMVVINHSDNISKDFLFYSLKMLEPFLKSQTSGSGIPNVDKEILGNFEIIIFDKTEQTQIAAILSTVDKAIEQTEALIAKYRRIKTGLMQDLLTKGIDEHGNIRSEKTHAFKDSPLGRIPVEWEVKQCHEICNEIVVGIVIKPAQYYISEGVPLLRSLNIGENKITLSDMKYISPKDNVLNQKSILGEGDILTVRSGYPGTTSIVPKAFVGANCVDLIISRPSKSVFSEYYAIWLNSSLGKKQIANMQGGLAQQHFNVTALKKLLISLPEIDEQEKIVEKLNQMDQTIDNYISYTNKLQKLKTGLMQDLLTGKVRVTGTNRPETTLEEEINK